MSVPGMNVLALAGQLIKFQTIQHSLLKGLEPDVAGIVQPVYFQPPVEAQASVQPVPRNMYESMGLDLQKYYVTVYSDATLRIHDLERGRAGDLVDFEGERFTVESNTSWVNQDGWRASICVYTGKTPT